MEKYYYLHPGYVFFSDENFVVETVLGSCVSVCLWDRVKKAGVINHFIFPKKNLKDNNYGNYGDSSVEYIIRLMLKNGSKIENLEATIVGGAQHSKLKMNIGEQNISIAHEILKKYNITVKKEIIGGYKGRKLKFNTLSGSVEVYDIN